MATAPGMNAQDVVIDLGQIAAGGDGVGAVPDGNIGINADTGAFLQARLNVDVPEANGINPMPVDGVDGSADSPFIDSVFVMDFGIGQTISTSGVTFDFDAGDVAQGWEGILNGREPGGPDSLSFGAAGPFTNGVGLHAAQGITYDLEAIRDAHGEANVKFFSAIAGEASGQAAGFVNAYVVLSDESGIIASESVLGVTDGGSFVVLEIPDTAIFLTLAVGAAGNGIGSDHGAFGLARITPTAPVVERTGIEVVPTSFSLAPGASAQLTVSAIDDLGLRSDVSAGAAGTTYSADPAGIVSISADGLVTGAAVGVATITASNGAFSANAQVSVSDFIDLGGIVAGGDGVLPPPEGNIGINADTGLFIQTRLNVDVPEANGINPMPVDGLDGSDDSLFIDSVFVMDVGVGQVINTSGVTFDFDAGDVAQGWEGILNGREAGGPDFLVFGPIGPFSNGLGVHAAQGITFDLEALREEHGAGRVKHFSAIAGEASGQAAGNVNAYAVLSDENDVISSASVLRATDRGELIQLEIPDDALFLTLAVGAAGDGIGSDHGGFGLARISSTPVDTSNIGTISVDPQSIAIKKDETKQLTVTGTLVGGELEGLRVPVDLANVSFVSANAAVATVDATGLVKGVSDGRTSITVTVGQISAEVRVSIGTVIDLGDIVKGGDGLGGVFVFNIGIDPRNGFLVGAGIDGTIRETDPEGDGLNPSPVEESPFIDSVFFIGPTDAPGEPTYAQGITQSEVSFDFPTADAIGTGWNHIISGANGGISNGPMLVGAQTFERGVGIHASTGITFDLDELRTEHGADKIGTFSTFWGMDACAGDVILYAIFSNDEGVISNASQQALANQGFLVELGIPVNAQYLTLATGSNGADGCDHGSFAEAIIVPGGAIEPPSDGFVRGDSDGSGATNITDGIVILNFLFTGGVTPGCRDAADADDSGAINITDGIYVLNFLFLGGDDPLPPYPACGTDPSGDDDGVTCETPHAACV
jgi:hypothetical protein